VEEEPRLWLCEGGAWAVWKRNQGSMKVEPGPFGRGVEYACYCNQRARATLLVLVPASPKQVNSP
jgi:hypothetical protein